MDTQLKALTQVNSSCSEKQYQCSMAAALPRPLPRPLPVLKEHSLFPLSFFSWKEATKHEAKLSVSDILLSVSKHF